MKNKKKYLFIVYLISTLINSPKVNGQEPVFGQFNLNPIYMNPALSGLNNVWSLGMNFRQQWPSVTSKFLTQSISIDSPIHGRLSGSLLYLKNIEGEGFLNSNYIRNGTSYSVPLFSNKGTSIVWKFGLEYQYYSRSIDWSRLVFLDELHPLYGDIYNSSFIIPLVNSNSSHNVHFGSLISINKIEGSNTGKKKVKHNKYILLGAAIHNLNSKTRDGFMTNNYFIPRKYTLHGEIWWNKKSWDAISILKHSFFYQEQSVLKTLQIGIIETDFAPFSIGTFYRLQLTRIQNDNNPQESFYLKVGFNKAFSNNLSLTVAYSRDFTSSELSTSTNGINEISIIIRSIEYGLFTNEEKERKRRLNSQIKTSCQFYSAFDGNVFQGGINPTMKKNSKNNKNGIFKLNQDK